MKSNGCHIEGYCGSAEVPCALGPLVHSPKSANNNVFSYCQS